MGILLTAAAWQDDRFDKSFDESTGFRTGSVICVPIFKAAKRVSRGERKAAQLAGVKAKSMKKERGACFVPV
eukprot:COSAG01_NODE_2686_length_7252_cov_3.534741_3_plen_72_part_00